MPARLKGRKEASKTRADTILMTIQSSPVPATPGFSASAIYIHPSVEAGGGAVFPRGGQLDVGLEGRGNIVAFGPTWTFEDQVLGGQLGISLFAVFGRNDASVDAILTGPNGNTISGNVEQTITG